MRPHVVVIEAGLDAIDVQGGEIGLDGIEGAGRRSGPELEIFVCFRDALRRPKELRKRLPA
jgi:hypothetical protein